MSPLYLFKVILWFFLTFPKILGEYTQYNKTLNKKNKILHNKLSSECSFDEKYLKSRKFFNNWFFYEKWQRIYI